MKTRQGRIMERSRQTGAALIVGLIMLLALTILGVAGMNMSRTELIMARNSQIFSGAQSDVASQLDIIMDPSQLPLGQTVTGQTLDGVIDAGSDGTWSSTLLGIGPVPGGGFSAGEFSAQHYEIRVALTDAGMPVNIAVVQGAYLIGPAQ